ncbi:PhoH family protein [Mucilaginibacter phyllosphaerae]|uniref:PhoH family protein n=1 Tax=Mucilaginibacter phyllosphaerae TaxID=1812349 RepID=A0A4Y8ABH2_9SPHI|nr:PhoH family protein [Mucilaginibacter phyllosphaerae]MBB3969345.1 PhoH-like ATPase [Mucilaginibacter phyllosphaerae]TEW65865.1 PhoH family protein [Mucilaginibacter phyllosphaerae]GGH07839.1 phosphate starvation protein PhoH [Mucilaginibacter phyllosphaerae]
MKESTGKTDGKKKIFVLDTSVILYDHNAFENFQEHDVAIPIQVLEELDNMKSGNDTRNFEARSFIRLMDDMAKSRLINQWIPLNGKSKGLFKVIMDAKNTSADAEIVFGSDKIDHRILNAALGVQFEYPDRKVILVSKDICLRLKAKSLNLYAEDYETGKIKNIEELYSGKTTLNKVTEKILTKLNKNDSLPIDGLGIDPKAGNQFYILNSKNGSASGFYNSQSGQLEKVTEQPVLNIQPRNAEQAYAIHALLHPDIKLVTIQGNAGTGKTLLALASALEQRKHYRQIFVTRPIVPLSNKDIGFLPGDVKSKIDPYMAPIWDNLKFIKDQFAEDEKMQAKLDELVSNDKISITPLAFIRGRTLSKIFFIVDEAQNLTPHEVKTIISRAGENSKFVFTGDIYQIDTPYLDAESNGLSYLIDKAKGHPLYAHITLQKGERSELANLATELL